MIGGQAFSLDGHGLTEEVTSKELPGRRWGDLGGNSAGRRNSMGKG